MGRKRKGKQGPSQPPKRRWGRLVAVVLIAVGAAGVWWVSAAQSPAGGARLVVDRSEVDLGRFPYEARARAVFTLTNAGDGPLRIVEVSPVKALKGC